MGESDFVDYLRFLLALVAVLALIGGLAWILQRSRASLPWAGRGPKGARLAVLETIALDARRRLVLVRRDDSAHLLLLGAQSDLVVERGIALPPEVAKGADQSPGGPEG